MKTNQTPSCAPFEQLARVPAALLLRFRGLFNAITAILAVTFLAGAAPKPEELCKRLAAIADGFPGKLGYSPHHLKWNERLDRLGDEKF